MKIKDLGIYIHIPFCVRKCYYCDFLSGPCGESGQLDYKNALIKEITMTAPNIHEDNPIVKSVFFGGGTPSILKADYIHEILSSLKKNLTFADDVEVTMECNPGTLTREKLQIYKKSGINRISLGLQSTVNDELKELGRIHTYEDFLESFRLVREEGFTNVNIDIMAALPGQTTKSYKKTLERVVSLNPEHISAYSLIIEEGTPFYERYHKEDDERSRYGSSCDGPDTFFSNKHLPDEDTERAMYTLTEEILRQYGYGRYEISNYSKPGYECRHNKFYWNGTSYIGFGIGAASYYKNTRSSNIESFDDYCNRLKDGGNSLCQIKKERTTLTKKEQMEEFMFLGLRMMEGVSLQDFEERFLCSYSSVYGEVTGRLMNLSLVEEADGYIRLTKEGIDVSNYVMGEFLLDS